MTTADDTQWLKAAEDLTPDEILDVVRQLEHDVAEQSELGMKLAISQSMNLLLLMAIRKEREVFRRALMVQHVVEFAAEHLDTETVGGITPESIARLARAIKPSKAGVFRREVPVHDKRQPSLKYQPFKELLKKKGDGGHGQ